MARSRLTLDKYKEGILNFDKAVLGQAITLIESQSASDRQLATQLVNTILPYTGKSFRLGITGSPGVGKSTFIDGFGSFLIEKDKKVAVLAVDPSSKISGGSILGDKTRMEKLVGKENAFVRPSPAGFELGGVAQRTFESILLCEAAGFDMIFVETVGVGQSETSVKEMTDFLLFLTIAGAGDELQGIKRGIMEMIDLVAINKSDLLEKEVLGKLRSNLNYALHLFPEKTSGQVVSIIPCSAYSGDGFGQILLELEKFEANVKLNGFFDENRNIQKVNWMNRSILNMIQDFIQKNPKLKENVKRYESEVLNNQISPIDAASKVFELLNLVN